MGLVAILLLHFSFVLTVLVTQTQAWAHEIPYKDLGKEKVTRLHFYFHDIVAGDNATAVRVAEAPMTDQSPLLFGALMMVDDPLTEGPEITSRLVGRGQGFYGLAGQNEGAIVMAISCVFTVGKFNGSTLNIFSRNPFTAPIREFEIVGGTGLFRFARGFILAKTYSISYDAAVVEYNVTAIHY